MFIKHLPPRFPPREIISEGHDIATPSPPSPPPNWDLVLQRIFYQRLYKPGLDACPIAKAGSAFCPIDYSWKDTRFLRVAALLRKKNGEQGLQGSLLAQLLLALLLEIYQTETERCKILLTCEIINLWH